MVGVKVVDPYYLPTTMNDEASSLSSAARLVPLIIQIIRLFGFCNNHEVAYSKAHSCHLPRKLDLTDKVKKRGR